MVHRRLQEDDNRGVQEPLNETMCGCNDIRAAPGAMGAHGHEGDGGCFCAGLTVRGRHLLVFDEVQRARALRRRLMEEIQQPPALAFARLGTPSKTPSRTVLAEALPPNVKLVTLANPLPPRRRKHSDRDKCMLDYSDDGRRRWPTACAQGAHATHCRK